VSAIFTDHFFREELSRKIFEFHKDTEYFTIEQLYSYATKDIFVMDFVISLFTD
jgi:hypothetical protein